MSWKDRTNASEPKYNCNVQSPAARFFQLLISLWLKLVVAMLRGPDPAELHPTAAAAAVL
jgi:hypothetical protein